MLNKSQISFDEFELACTSYVSHHHHHDTLKRPQDQVSLGPHQFSKRWTWVKNSGFPKASHLFRRFTLVNQAAAPRIQSPSKEKNSSGKEPSTVEKKLLEKVEGEETYEIPDYFSGEAEDPATHLQDLSPSDMKDNTTSRSTVAETELIQVEQSIVYSSTWRVPVLYFSIYSNDGVPLSLSQLLQSSFLVKSSTSTLPLDDTSDSKERSSADPISSKLSNLDIPSDSHRSLGEGDELATFASLSQGDHPITGLSSFYLHPCQTATFMETIRKSDAEEKNFQEDGDEDENFELIEYLETFVMLCSSAVEMKSF